MKKQFCVLGMVVFTLGVHEARGGLGDFVVEVTAAAQPGEMGHGGPGHPMRRCDPSNPNACGRHAYCRQPNGACDSEDTLGICTPIPRDCPSIREPVCSCDGETYPNRCVAFMHRASIAHPGPCGQACRRDAAEPCPDDHFCVFPPGSCDQADPPGVCRMIPVSCPDVHDPVCGCDGVTYGNRCEAGMAGQSIEHRGPCEQVCGGIAGIPCDDGEVCVFPPGTCNVSDQQGVCRPLPCFPDPPCCPEHCPKVCGCDGVTYCNECEATVVGVAIDHPGECEHVCGGIAGIPCDDGEFCRLPVGSCCCDFQGVCKPIPDGCPDIYEPVCGCDGVTYGNRCEAAMAGQSIDHHGECPE
ncbi:MAG: Kazal-type serine protease inhibitor domain-containing protein [Planctomycetota bacterium]